jgi:hypothetical protein
MHCSPWFKGFEDERVPPALFIDMLEFPPYFVLGAAIVGASYLISLWFQSATYKLRHIPTLGSSSLIGSYFDGHKFAKHGHELVREGVKKFKGGIFKIADMGEYKVIVIGQDMISDIRRARDDQLSFDEAVKDASYIHSTWFNLLIQAPSEYSNGLHSRR